MDHRQARRIQINRPQDLVDYLLETIRTLQTRMALHRLLMARHPHTERPLLSNTTHTPATPSAVPEEADLGADTLQGQALRHSYSAVLSAITADKLVAFATPWWATFCQSYVKPGVGTRGGHAPKSLFQASHGQTTGHNGLVSDSTGKDMNEDESQESTRFANGKLDKAQERPKTLRIWVRLDLKEPRISFKLAPAKQTPGTTSKADLFAGKMAQMKYTGADRLETSSAFHENYRDDKGSR